MTVLYPFVPPELIDAGLLAKLQAVVGSVPSFSVHFLTVNWFADQVVWLAPEPDAPFRELTKLVTERWPSLPPYGGKYPDVTPHLTFGEGGSDEPEEAARQVLTNFRRLTSPTRY